jgi:GT2 family glycosyltransferase
LNEASKIGIVTVTYNSRKVVDGFLESVLQQTYTDFQLYLIDNCSTDGTVERISEYSDPRITVIKNGSNLGIAEGNNQGTEVALNAGSGLILFINNDTEFEPHLIEKLVRALKVQKCDLIAPKILFHDKQEVIWSAGGGFNRWKGYAGFHYGVGQTDRGQFDIPRLVDHAPACCLLVRREVFARIGLMDALYFVYLDDSDFCFRARRAGLKLFYLPSATLLHKASSLTGGPDSEFSVRYCTRNHIYFMLKHFGIWKGLCYLAGFQFFLLFKLFSRKIDMTGFLLRERAFAEGFRVWRHSTIP